MLLRVACPRGRSVSPHRAARVPVVESRNPWPWAHPTPFAGLPRRARAGGGADSRAPRPASPSPARFFRRDAGRLPNLPAARYHAGPDDHLLIDNSASLPPLDRRRSASRPWKMFTFLKGRPYRPDPVRGPARALRRRRHQVPQQRTMDGFLFRVRQGARAGSGRLSARRGPAPRSHHRRHPRSSPADWADMNVGGPRGPEGPRGGEDARASSRR